MSKNTRERTAEATAIGREELEDLKREMRTAHLAAWAESHRRQLGIAAAVVLAAVLLAGLWWDHVQTQRKSAATLFHQALAAGDVANKRVLLQKVTTDFSGTAYGGLAAMLLAKYDPAQAARHLRSAMANPRLDRELHWQARLDLARILLRKSDKAGARKVLAEHVGADYEQLRQYLLARAADSVAERRSHLQKAAAAVDHDRDLKQRIESELQRLQSSDAGAGRK